MPNWAGLSPRGILNLLRPISSSRRRLRRFSEKILYGGPLRENILVRLLGALHRSQHRRDWILHDGEAPHFYNQRWNGFNFTYGEHRSPAVFTRGFLAAEVIRPGDSLLDIGCGDGFFTKTFFSNDCARIDALDIEPSAVAAARRMNPAPNIDYQLRDAVRDPFPRQNYDVIVWDGAVGHFSADDLETMLSKIAQALAPDGIFVGSETLGREGHDHLQFFPDAASMAALFKPFFPVVRIRVRKYVLDGGYPRTEAYWRCSRNPTTRHSDSEWKSSDQLS